MNKLLAERPPQFRGSFRQRLHRANREDSTRAGVGVALELDFSQIFCTLDILAFPLHGRPLQIALSGSIIDCLAVVYDQTLSQKDDWLPTDGAQRAPDAPNHESLEPKDLRGREAHTATVMRMSKSEIDIGQGTDRCLPGAIQAQAGPSLPGIAPAQRGAVATGHRAETGKTSFAMMY